MQILLAPFLKPSQFDVENFINCVTGAPILIVRLRKKLEKKKQNISGPRCKQIVIFRDSPQADRVSTCVSVRVVFGKFLFFMFLVFFLV